jgi:hypothetical protein
MLEEEAWHLREAGVYSAQAGQKDSASYSSYKSELATQYGRYGYRRITALLNQNPKERSVNHKKVERIWGMEVPKKQPKRRRLWLNDGSCIRLRPIA